MFRIGREAETRGVDETEAMAVVGDRFVHRKRLRVFIYGISIPAGSKDFGNVASRFHGTLAIVFLLP